MGLEVEIFDGFIIRTPIWIASSHLTAEESAIERWKPFRPAAITLKTSSAQLGGSGKGQSRTYVQLENTRSWFTDGPKEVELLSVPRTQELLDAARAALEETQIGVSVLSGEDYLQFKELVRGADFVELNLKYEARLEGADALNESFSKFHEETHSKLMSQIELFSNAFPEAPQFIKLTRELAWLRPCSEWAAFVGLLQQLAENGRRIGLIIANTERARVPPSMVPARPQLSGFELSGGVLAGSALFMDTYRVLRDLTIASPELDRISLIATGGILTVPEIVDMFYAGARAVQLCTVFQELKPEYSAWLEGQLSRIMDRSKCASLDQFRRLLRMEGESALSRIRSIAREIEMDFSEFVRHQFQSKVTYVSAVIKSTLEEDLRRTNASEPPLRLFEKATQEAGRLSGSSDKLPLDVSSPEISFPASSWKSRNIVVLSMLGSITAHAFFLSLKKRDFPLSLSAANNSSDVIRLIGNQDWDLAILSRAHSPDLEQLAVVTNRRPIALGVVARGAYQLRAATELEDVDEIYSFNGKQAVASLQALVAKHRSLTAAKLSTGTPAMVAKWTQQLGKNAALVAQDPLGTLYSELLPGPKELKVLADEEVEYWLYASEAFLTRSGPKGLAELAQAIGDIASEDSAELWSVLEEDQIADRVMSYMIGQSERPRTQV